MLVGARQGGVTVGVVEKEFRSEVSSAAEIFVRFNLLSINICSSTLCSIHLWVKDK